MSIKSLTFCVASLVVAILSASADSTAPGSSGASAAPAVGCSANMEVVLDRGSFRSPGLTSPRLEIFRNAAGRAFKAAAEELCASRKLSPRLLRQYRRLLIQSGSGATDAAIYSDPNGLGRDTLVFQWVFDEEDLALPNKSDIEEGLLCWADPRTKGCEAREP